MFQTSLLVAAESPAIVDKVIDFLSMYGLRVVGAILILVIGSYLAKLFAKGVYKALSKTGRGETLAKFLSGAVNAVVMVFVVIAVIGKLGIETTSASWLSLVLPAWLSAWLCRALWETWLQASFLIIFRPYGVGDGVQIGAVSGTVLDIQIFSTVIQTGENKKVIIPNGKITGDIITNFTALGSRRLEIAFMIDPTKDLTLVRETIRSILEAEEKVLKSPAFDMVVADWGDKVKLVVRPFVQPKDIDMVQSILLEKINRAL
jgi:small conductance mechanosensitive channel